MKNDIITLVGIAFTAISLFVLACLLEGLALVNLWEWYVVPLGCQQISFFHAIGLSLLVNLLTYHFYDFQKNDKPSVIQPLMFLLVRPLVVLSVGWLLHFFV